MKRWIFAIFSIILLVPLARATVNDGHVVTTVGYVTHEMGTLQDKIPSQTGTKAMTFGDEAGEIGARTVKTDLGTSTSDTSLPTVSAVNDKLDDKQNEIPAKNTNTVLTYTGVEGSVGEKGIYQNSGTYAGQMDSLVTAGTFNAALKNGLDNEFVCAETDPANGQCWAYSINNNGGPWNYFNMDDIPERTSGGAGTVARNADGSITINGYAVATSKTLKELAPGLEVGKTYKFSINTTSNQRTMLLLKTGESNTHWSNNSTKTITADMLNRKVYFYTSSNSSDTNQSATIYEIKITKVDSGTPVGASGTILPAGYTPLAYIESNGTQWIDTGIRGHMGYTYELEFQQTAIGNYRHWGVFNQSGYKGQNMSLTYASGTNWFVRWEKTTTGERGVALSTQNTDSNVLRIVDGQVYFNGVNKGKSAGHDSTFVFDYNMFLGTINPGGRTPTNNAKSKYYSYKVWNTNGTLIQNLVPAKRTSDNAIGMYDTVSNTFLTNAGTGTFIAGPEVSNNVYIPQNQ